MKLSDMEFANYLPIKRADHMFLRILLLQPKKDVNEEIIFSSKDVETIMNGKYKPSAIIKNLVRLGYISEIEKDMYILNEEFYDLQVQKIKAFLLDDKLTEEENNNIKRKIYRKLNLFSVVIESQHAKEEQEQIDKTLLNRTEMVIDDCITKAKEFIRLHDNNKVISFKTKSGIKKLADIAVVLYNIEQCRA